MISASMSEASAARLTLSGRLARVIATGLGSGYSPIAPGTAGSLVGLLCFWPLARVPLVWLAVALVGLFFVGVAASTAVAAQVGLHDPGIVVVDEVIGMWITLAAAAVHAAHGRARLPAVPADGHRQALSSPCPRAPARRVGHRGRRCDGRHLREPRAAPGTLSMLLSSEAAIHSALSDSLGGPGGCFPAVAPSISNAG